ncbi:MAG: hypothetical protein AB7S38_26235 [Vulcanimicrobiota bacterium]
MSRFFIGVLVFFVLLSSSGPCLAQGSGYELQEWSDYYNGLRNLGPNQQEAWEIYQELRQFSGQEFQVVFGQTFRWGEARPGGVIILDVSTMQKPRPIHAYKFAHEWGHQALGHVPNIYNPQGNQWRMRFTHTQDEDEADVYAGRFLAAAGYDVEPVLGYLRSLPPSPAWDTHSPGHVRAELVLTGYRGGGPAPTPTVRRVPCQHLMPCAHRFPCGHLTPYGPMHPFDQMHQADTMHPFDSVP